MPRQERSTADNMCGMKRHLAGIPADVRLPLPLLDEAPSRFGWALDRYVQCEFRCVYAALAYKVSRPRGIRAKTWRGSFDRSSWP